MKVQKTAGAFSTMSVNLERQSPSGVFLRNKIIFDFFWQGARRSVCNTRNCAQKISYFYVFLEKDRLSLSSQGKNMFSEKKNIFPDNTRKVMSRWGSFWKDHLLGTFEENIIFPCIFLRKIIFHFPSKR